jgi:hypothetical protein
VVVWRDTVLAGLGWFLFEAQLIGQQFESSRAHAQGLPAPVTTGTELARYAAGAVIWTFLAVRLRRSVNRAADLGGLLPEERQSNGMWVLCACLGPFFAAPAAQGSLNELWNRFPRYFKSIGSTREALDDDGPMSVAPAWESERIVGLTMPARSQVAAVTMPARVEAPAATVTPAERMVQLQPLATAGTISVVDAYEYARAIEEVHGAEAAAPWFEYVFRRDAQHRAAAFWYGCYALDHGDVAGLPALESTLADPAYAAYAQVRIDRHRAAAATESAA